MPVAGIDGCELCADESAAAIAAPLERVLRRGGRCAGRDEVRRLDETVLTQEGRRHLRVGRTAHAGAALPCLRGVATLRVETREGRVRFAVRVQPRASQSEIAGVHGDALKVRVAAPPVDGAANAALVELLAAALGIAKRNVRIISGDSSRGKIIEVDGVDVENIRRLARQSG